MNMHRALTGYKPSLPPPTALTHLKGILFLPGEFCGQRSLAGYSSRGCRVRHD